MDRRSLLKGATALAGIPIVGRYVLDNPRILSGVPSIAGAAPALLVPEAQQLVIASEMPARNVSGFSMWPTRWQIELSRDSRRLYDWDGNATTIAGPATAEVRLEGMLSHADDIHALRTAFASGRQFRIYVEPVPG